MDLRSWGTQPGCIGRKSTGKPFAGTNYRCFDSLDYCSWRGDWLARFAGSPAGQDQSFHQDCFHQRTHLGNLAYPADHRGRVQQRSTHLVCPGLFHDSDHRCFICFCLATPCLGKHLAGCPNACHAQHIDPKLFR